MMANKSNWLDILNQFAIKAAILIDAGEDVKLEAKPHKMTRSDAQNRLYWLWMGEVQRHMEEARGINASAEEWHEVIAEKMLPPTISKVNNKPMRVSTARLSTKEFADYLQRLEVSLLTNHGLQVTQPQDLYLNALMKG